MILWKCLGKNKLILFIVSCESDVGHRWKVSAVHVLVMVSATLWVNFQSSSPRFMANSSSSDPAAFRLSPLCHATPRYCFYLFNFNKAP